ncbi:hypothetical protein J2S43_006229 [Catenuloplanes nepalensis]|uniref:Lipoprotein n=1 Tax=Catenuloplanes nepalensis TaxID=587533 RepID=A0ABT9N200_9ACTN|nr:hypothetical protein [Catenuloplanes nepalensis]MDP9797717.1 hypothetical protein [Catenuloplanes nepalensis]
MIRRFGTLALAVLALTACTNSGDDTANGPLPSPSTVSVAPPPSAAAPSSTASAPSSTAPEPAPAPGETGSGDWKAALAAALECPAAALPVEQGPMFNRDITGDGVPDVLVAAACTGSTSSWPSVVHAYDGAPPAGQWRRLGVLLTQGDGVDERGLRVKQILIDDGTVVVTSRAFQQKDDNASGGTLTVTDRFTWSGTGFTRGERTIA